MSKQMTINVTVILINVFVHKWWLKNSCKILRRSDLLKHRQHFCNNPFYVSVRHYYWPWKCRLIIQTDFITIFKTIWGAAVWCNMEENALYAPGKKREHRFCVLIMICVRGNRHYWVLQICNENCCFSIFFPWGKKPAGDKLVQSCSVWFERNVFF